MTLGRKLTIKIVSQLVGVTILCGVGFWGFSSLRTALDRTTDQFSAMREIHRIGHHLTIARSNALQKPANTEVAHMQISYAIRAFEEFASIDQTEASSSDSSGSRDLQTLLTSASKESDPARLASHATRGLSLVQRQSQRIQWDVRQRRETAITINDSAMRNLLIAGTLLVIFSAAVGISQRRSVVRPLASLRHGIRRLQQSGPTEPVECVGDSEFQSLAASFNEMALELQHARETLEHRIEERTTQLIRSERLARLGVLAAGFAHEINNPLAIIRGHAELAVRHWMNGSPDRAKNDVASEMAEALTVTLDEVDRSHRIVERLQSLGARQQHGCDSTTAELSIDELITTAIGLIDPIARKAGTRVQYQCICDPIDARAPGDTEEFVQVMINLLLNAIEATSACNDGAIRITCERIDQMVRVRVADNGTGMSSDQIANAFDPFVSGSGGTGLGLAICESIADRHGAHLIAQSDGIGFGSTFSIHLPVRHAEAAA